MNGVGTECRYDDSLFHPVALQVAKLARVNPWLFFAAQNGDGFLEGGDFIQARLERLGAGLFDGGFIHAG